MKNVCVEKKLLVSLAKNNWNSISNRFFFESENVARGAKKKRKKQSGKVVLNVHLIQSVTRR